MLAASNASGSLRHGGHAAICDTLALVAFRMTLSIACAMFIFFNAEHIWFANDPYPVGIIDGMFANSLILLLLVTD